MKKCTVYTLFTGLYLLLAASGRAQNLPCSINAGGAVDVCFYDKNFQLQGLVGSNVDLNTVDWDVSNPAAFQIEDENDPSSLVTPLLPGGFPAGSVVFTLTAQCLDGTPLSASVEITVSTLGSSAQILANGADVEDIRVCSSVTLSAGQLPGPGEVGTWKAGDLDDLLIIAGEASDPSIVLSIDPNNSSDCNTYTYYYEISNGGCVTTDSVVVTFEGGAPEPQFTYPYNNQGICTGGDVPLSGSPVGCTGVGTFEVISVPPGATIPPIQNYEVNRYSINATATVDQAGEYVFAYHVEVNDGICPEGSDTIRVFVCLTPAGFQDIWEEYCGIPKQISLLSPEYPGAHYEPWTWSSLPPLAVDTPVITHLNDWTASVDISNLGVTSYVFTQKIVLDTCRFPLGPVTDTLECPVDYLQYNENYQPILHIVCGKDGTYSIESLDPYFVEGLVVDPLYEDGVWKYVLHYNLYTAVVCYITHTVIYYGEVHLPDTTVNLLCGGINPYDTRSCYPNPGYPNVRFKALTVPPGHPSLHVGNQFFGYPKLNLQPPGQYVFEVVMYSVDDCRDTSYLTINVDNIPDPVAPDISDFCVNETVQVVGSLPGNPAVQVLWIQLSGPPLTFLDPVTTTDPRILATQPGEYALEYSFSRTEDCYLADTSYFEVFDCNYNNCLKIELLDIRCFDNGSADPNDDYWNFDIIVHQGPGSYWEAPAVPEAGAYEQLKTIWPGSIAAAGSTYTLVVQDHDQPTCTATLEVPVPKPCSEPCELALKTEVGPCQDNGTPLLMSDDYYFVSLSVLGIGDECWMVKRSNPDGTSQVLGSYNGSSTVTLGPFLVQDGNWGLWVVLCDQMTCSADVFILAPPPCSGCHDVVISNITCYDNGSSAPSDDHWSFDMLVNGGTPGSYWTATAPVSQSGPYWQTKTIYMGQINQYGAEIEFSIFDHKNEACRTDVKVPVPRFCSDECKLAFETQVLECRRVERTLQYFVRLSVSNTDGGCWMAKQKRADGTEVVLGTWYGDQTVELGPFDPALGDWTLWVMRCGQFDCVRDQFIEAPKCDGKGEARPAVRELLPATGYTLYPSPAISELQVLRATPADATANGAAIFQVMDRLGNSVLERMMPPARQYRLSLDALPPGLYFLMIREPGEAAWAGKFYKQ